MLTSEIGRSGLDPLPRGSPSRVFGSGASAKSEESAVQSTSASILKWQWWRGGLAMAGLVVALAAGLSFEIAGMRRTTLPVAPDSAMRWEIIRDTRIIARCLIQPEDVKSWESASLMRPLFSPDRLPPAQARPAMGAPARLAGILISATQQIAIFANTNGGQIVRSDGDRLGAYEIVSIASGGVYLHGPEGTLLVRPAYDSNAGTGFANSAAAFEKNAPARNEWPIPLDVSNW